MSVSSFINPNNPNSTANFSAKSFRTYYKNGFSNGVICMKDENTFNIDSNNGEGIVNITGSSLNFNGVPISGGGSNMALDQCFAEPVKGTFSSPPIYITDTGANSAILNMANGGILGVSSPNMGRIGEISCDNDGVLLTAGNITKTSQAVNSEIQKGAQISLVDSSNTQTTNIYNDNGKLRVDSSGDIILNTQSMGLNGNSKNFNIDLSTSDLNVIVYSSGASNNIQFNQNVSVQAGKSFNIYGAMTLYRSDGVAGYNISAVDNGVGGCYALFDNNASSYLFQSPIYNNSFLVQSTQNGNTASRPSSPVNAQIYFDNDLGYPIWWRSSTNEWINSLGVSV